MIQKLIEANIVQKLIIVVLTGVVLLITGCVAWQQGLTPAYIDPVAIDYAETEPTIFTPYTSLYDARRVERELDYQHMVNQVKIYRCIEDDNIKYNHIKNALQLNIQHAEQLQSTLFDPEGGILPLLLAGSGFGIGALAISKPSDKRRIDELKNGSA